VAATTDRYNPAMGRLGRSLGAATAGAVCAALTRALADEWFAHYNYWLASQAVRGHWSPGVVELLAAKSARALSRADGLSRRARELGAEPPAKLADLLDRASDKPFKLPRSIDDPRAILRAVLDAERTSIRTYAALVSRAGERDVLTRRLAEDYLGEAVAGEQQLERLLGEDAPGLDGR